MRRILFFVIAVGLLGGGLLWAAPSQQANLFEAFLLDTRVDLEQLANEVYGEGDRPDTWTSNADLASDTFVADLWFDNEQLADRIYGFGTRPQNWFGLPPGSNRELIARNVRHDLEVMADETYGSDVRPEGWNGAAGIFQCSRTLQNLVTQLDRIYNTRPTTTEAAFDFCAALQAEVETELVSVIFSRSIADASLPSLALAVRGDLERLADETLGLNNRPTQWTDNRDEASPTLIADTAADLSRLADELLGANVRPEEWNGFLPGSPSLAYRNLRFNLEVLADVTLGEEVRPTGWQGVDPLLVCDPLDQALFFVAEQNFRYSIPNTIIDSPNFCQLLAEDTNNLIENPPPEVIEDGQGGGEVVDARFLGESEFAFTYLDVSALQYMGIMPAGTEFRAWYRNFQDSNMMFVSGADFAVYIDRRWTTLSEDVFNTLPTLDGVRPLTFCDAFWCNGPAPTPTPTGGSAVELLANAQTPAPTPAAPGELGAGAQQREVSWNHVRVSYLLDRPDLGTVQVTLELCETPAQIACEPVTSVFDQSVNAAKPVLSQLNGLNVYEFPYGYLTNLIIESQNFVSPDVWISDPTIR